ncbi:efflux transporter outer membrane subunit [Herbaspirillum sp. YR522]|uniref:efflux transporter outer membrane subunit n=1 Tax=Herbaspirillum sp. YR522 TaxID=1144342 RepID=UPI00026F7F7E|nr:efflux transporter outer membrane subunit [Herbaspirillum sp. YR522]EJN06908.1 efflux transporter, outer membrane factor lipoprotein, NodT family [Herbaspirillum sp. YR522]
MHCNKPPAHRLRAIAVVTALIGMVGLSGCASFEGIGSDRKMARPTDFATERSLADPSQAGTGQWPGSDWVRLFGDDQLVRLIDEALTANPGLQQARARIAAAGAIAESRGAPLLPSVTADASFTRNQFSATTIYPEPYGGNWYNEKKAMLNIGYELDLWNKNHTALAQAISNEKASQASEQEARLVLTAAIVSAYSQLATQYALHDILQRTADQRASLQNITGERVRNGLDTQIERDQSRSSSADARAQLEQSEGQILLTRQQLGALSGRGPDRGLQLAPPQVTRLVTPPLPAELPLNLLGRRPDIVAARWQVEAASSGIEVARARFYPDINLSAMIGFDTLLNNNPFTAASKSIAFGPAISLPIFEGGALRAGLKGEYANYELAVATYNRTLDDAYADVARQIAQIHSSERQLPIRREALEAAERAFQLARERYRLGLVSQLTLLSAESAVLAQRQAMVTLEAARRDQQIALFKALGGGFEAAQAGLALNAPSALPHTP